MRFTIIMFSVGLTVAFSNLNANSHYSKYVDDSEERQAWLKRFDGEH